MFEIARVTLRWSACVALACALLGAGALLLGRGVVPAQGTLYYVRLVSYTTRQSDLIALDAARGLHVRRASDMMLIAPLSIAPDGSTLARIGMPDAQQFSVQVIDLRTRALDAGTAQHIPSPSRFDSVPAFTPQRQAVVVEQFYDGVSGLYTLDLTTGASTLLTNGLDDYADVAWSPNGATLAYVAQNDLPAYNVYLWHDGGQRTAAFNVAAYTGLAWSPDGRYLAFRAADAPRRLKVLDTHSGQVRRLMVRPNLSALGWSPDGCCLAFAADDNRGRSQIYLLDLDSGGLRQVTHDPIGALRVLWVP